MNSPSGQNGYVWFVFADGRTLGSLQKSWFGPPFPFVQPRPVVFPAALSQPPAYHAQSTFAAESSSPIVTLVEGIGGSRRVTAVPGEYGWLNGCVVLTVKFPQTNADCTGGRLAGGLQDCV